MGATENQSHDVKGIPALAVKEIELIVRIETLAALQRALPQIEKVLREIYSSTDQDGIPD
jgi:hypothetical protein